MASMLYLREAKLSDDGSYCDVTFSTQTNEDAKRGLFRCSDILRVSFNTVPIDGASDFALLKCMWTSSATLRVLMGIDSMGVVKAGETRLYVRNDTSLSHLEVVSRPVYAFDKRVNIAVSSQPVAPRPIVKVSLVFASSIAGMYVDISRSAGDCDWPWKVMNISIRSGSFKESLFNLTLASSPIMSVRSRFDPVFVKLAKPLVASNVTVYYWFCNIVDVCEHSSMPLTVSRQLSRRSPPEARILYLGNTLMVSSRESVVVVGDAFVPMMTNDGNDLRQYQNLNFTWLLVDAILRSVVSASVSTNPRVFRLSPFTLLPDRRYTLLLNVTDESTRLTGESQQLSISCVSEPIVVTLVPSGPKVMTLIYGEVLLINASKSYDPDHPIGVKSHLRVVWRCVDESLQQCPLAIMLASDRWSVTILSNSSSSINVVCELTVTVWDITSPIRASNASVNVQVVSAPSSTPFTSQDVSTSQLTSILVSSPRSELESVRIDKALSLAVLVATSVPCVTQWSLVSATSKDTGVLSNATSLTVNTKAYTPVSLHIRPNSLVSAARYTFRLACNTVSVDIQVTTNQAPYGGALYVLPSSGKMLQTEFSLASMGWKDSSESLPLTYSFRFFFRNKWTSWPTISGYQYVDGLYMPGNLSDRIQYLPLLVAVSDTFDATSNSSSVVTLSGWTEKSRALESMLIDLIWNATQVSSLKAQQAIISVQLSLINGVDMALSASSTRNALSVAVAALGQTLPSTDESNLPAATASLELAVENLKTSSLVAAKELTDSLSQQGQSSVNSTALLDMKSQLSQAEVLLQMLRKTLLQLAALQEGSGNADDVIRLAVESSQYSLALAYYFVRGSSSGNSSVSFLPSISIPGSTNTISILDSVTNAGNAVVSVAQYNLALLLASNSSNTDVIRRLLSDIISIRLSYSSNTSAVVVPAFLANFSIVPKGNASSDSAVPIFAHNCTLGVSESVSFLCVDANVRMNLTCTGLSTAVIRRKCPVPKRVCNVLNLQEVSVTNEDYCVAVQSTPTSVICRCGFNVSSTNSSTLRESVIGPGGSVSVAVMTEYVASDFVNTVSITGGFSAVSVTGDSFLVLVAFGCFWGLGIFLVGIQLYSADHQKTERHNKRKANKFHFGNFLTAKSKIRAQPLPVRLAILQKSLHRYLSLALPSALRPMSWWVRLWTELNKRHSYLLVLRAFTSSHHERDASGLEVKQHRRKAILELAQMLTSVTLSCFLLAMLYDLQYPNDDGSCALHRSESLCLNRRSPLDPSQRYCEWVPAPEAQSAGVIYDIQAGVIIQTVLLQSELVVDDDPIESCRYASTKASSLATTIVAMFASIFSLIVSRILTFLFDIVGARTLAEAEIRDLAMKALAAQQQASSVVMSMPSSSSHGTQNNGVAASAAGRRGRRQAVLPVGSNMTVSSTSTALPVTSVVDTSIVSNADGAQKDSSELHSRRAEKTDSSSKSPKSTARRSSTWSSWFQAMLQSHFHWQTHQKHGSHLLVPEEVVSARKKFMDLVFEKADVQVRVGKASDERVALVRDILQQQDLVLSGPLYNSHSSQLRHATDIEYGVATIHQFVLDALGQNTPAAKLFTQMTHKDFAGAVSAVSDRAKWLSIATLIASNLAALYFVFSKGFQRGGPWQRRFLYACVLQWVMDEIFIQAMEILALDFYLPGLIFVDTYQLGVRPLLRSADKYLFASVVPQVAAMSSTQILVNSVIPSISKLAVSMEMALTREQLPESQWILLNVLATQSRQALLSLHGHNRRIQQSLSTSGTSGAISDGAERQPGEHLLSEPPSQRSPPRVTATMFSQSLRDAFLRRLHYLPLHTQRLLFRFLVSLLFGAMILAWLSIQRMSHGDLLLMAVSMGIFAIFLFIAWLSYYHQFVSFDYLDADTEAAQAAAIAVVSGEFVASCRGASHLEAVGGAMPSGEKPSLKLLSFTEEGKTSSVDRIHHDGAPWVKKFDYHLWEEGVHDDIEEKNELDDELSDGLYAFDDSKDPSHVYSSLSSFESSAMSSLRSLSNTSDDHEVTGRLHQEVVSSSKSKVVRHTAHIAQGHRVNDYSSVHNSASSSSASRDSSSGESRSSSKHSTSSSSGSSSSHRSSLSFEYQSDIPFFESRSDTDSNASHFMTDAGMPIPLNASEGHSTSWDESRVQGLYDGGTIMGSRDSSDKKLDAEGRRGTGMDQSQGNNWYPTDDRVGQLHGLGSQYEVYHHEYHAGSEAGVGNAEQEGVVRDIVGDASNWHAPSDEGVMSYHENFEARALLERINFQYEEYGMATGEEDYSYNSSRSEYIDSPSDPNRPLTMLDPSSFDYDTPEIHSDDDSLDGFSLSSSDK